MVMGKRGQIFLLAAVIISVVVLSLGATTNRAIINSEPDNFYDFGYEVKRESGAFSEYSVYTGGDVDDDVEIFTDSLVKNIKGSKSESNFVVIYGSNVTGITIKGRWKDSETTGIISYGDISINVNEDEFRKKFIDPVDLEDENKLIVTFGDQEFEFPIFEYKQVIFIIQKEVNDESFISVR
jgi:hypothetical protein